MTDKEIIINGVDVCKCLAYHPEFGDDYNCLATCSNCGNVCKESPNCYYKQLQRKEQECGELRKEKELYKTWYQTKHDDWADVFFKTIKSRDRYKQALEKIEGNIKNLHYATCIFHRGATHALADIVQEIKNKILDIINEVK